MLSSQVYDLGGASTSRRPNPRAVYGGDPKRKFRTNSPSQALYTPRQHPKQQSSDAVPSEALVAPGTAVVVFNGALVAVGATGAAGDAGAVYIMPFGLADSTTGWVRFGTDGEPQPPRCPNAAVCRKGARLFLHGGGSVAGDSVGVLLMEGHQKPVWGAVSMSPAVPRSHHALAVGTEGQDTLWLHGGCSPDGDGALDDLWRLDLHEHTATQFCAHTTVNLQGHAIVDVGASLLLFGGQRGDPNAHVYTFDKATKVSRMIVSSVPEGWHAGLPCVCAGTTLWWCGAVPSTLAPLDASPEWVKAEDNATSLAAAPATTADLPAACVASDDNYMCFVDTAVSPHVLRVLDLRNGHWNAPLTIVQKGAQPRPPEARGPHGVSRAVSKASSPPRSYHTSPLLSTVGTPRPPVKYNIPNPRASMWHRRQGDSSVSPRGPLSGESGTAATVLETPRKKKSERKTVKETLHQMLQLRRRGYRAGSSKAFIALLGTTLGSSLHTLDLSGVCLGCDDLFLLREVVAATPSVRKLRIVDQAFSNEEAAILLDTVRTCPHITELMMVNCVFDSHAAEVSLSRALCQNGENYTAVHERKRQRQRQRRTKKRLAAVEAAERHERNMAEVEEGMVWLAFMQEHAAEMPQASIVSTDGATTDAEPPAASPPS